MEEIEVKILEINLERIVSKLEELGAEEVFSGEIKAYHYDLPNEPITRKGDVLRLRKKGDKAEFVYKEKQESKVAKVNIEHEININPNDFETMRTILESLGLREIYALEKSRTSYRIGNTQFEIDIFPEIPPLLEIEAPDEETLKMYVKKLGYTMKDAKTWGSKELLLHYHKF